MTTLTTLTWRAPARTTVSGPAGWAPIETIEIRHTDGDAVVRVESWPVSAEADVDAVATAHVTVSAEIPGWQDGGLEPAVVLGRPDGRRREVSWTDGSGTRTVATMSYQIDRGRAVAVTAVVPASAADKLAEADSIAGAVRAGSPYDFDRHTDLPLRPSTADDFASVRPAWEQATGAPHPAPKSHQVTVEEALAAARHFDTAVLPGADPAVLASLDGAQQALVLNVAWRGLVARGVSAAGGLREALELAASHDLLMTVSAPEVEEWFAARPDRMVHVRRDAAAGLLSLTVHDTADLADLAIRAASSPAAEVTVRSLFRRGSAVSGGEDRFGPSPDADDVRARILDLLPASGR